VEAPQLSDVPERDVQRSRPWFRQPGWLIPAIVGGVVVVLVANLAPFPGSDGLHRSVQLCSNLAFAWFTVFGLRGHPRVMRVATTIFAVAIGVIQICWTFLGEYVSGPSGNGSALDVAYSVVLPIGIVGVISLAFHGVARLELARIASDALIVTTALMIISWEVVFSSASDNGALARPSFETIAVPAGDLIVMALLYVACIHQPRRISLRWLTIGVGVATVADLITTSRQLTDAVGPNTAIEIAWLLGPLLLAGAMTVSRPESAVVPVQSTRRLLIYGISGVAVALAGAGIVRHGSLGLVVSVLIIGMGLAITVNQVLIAAEIRALLHGNDEAMSLLRLSERRFRVAFEGAPVGIAVLDSDHFRSVNDRFAELAGRPPDQIVGHHFRDLVRYEELAVIDRHDWVHVGGATDSLSRELHIRRPDGTFRWLHMTVARSHGADRDRQICIMQDVTESRANRSRLEHLAVHDQLTGLPNRQAFMANLDRMLREQVDACPTVAFLDLDRFKVINDSLGHAAGDQVLCIVAERIAEAASGHATVARFAGDEFVLLIPSDGTMTPRAVLEQVLDTVRRPVDLGGGLTNYPTVSIGYTAVPPGGADAEQVLGEADAAMYRAKERGRNRIEQYDVAGGGGAARELQIVGELHRALAEQQFRAHYQPIVDLSSGMTTGWEALIRWQHPERGLLPPAAFIDAAEETGLIVPIGEWILREAIGQIASWNRRFGWTRTMSVNLAARQITDDFAELLDDVLVSTGMDPDLIWLEITETALMVDVHTAETVLHRITGMGVHLTVDDFGTGYSSLTYLQRFPVEGLKIDKSFTDGLHRDPQADAICEGVVSLGRALGLKTVAEGIEDRIQLERLRAMGCPLGQGYLFGRPVPADEVEALMAPDEAPLAPIPAATPSGS